MIHETLGVGLRHGSGVHLHVTPELAVGVRICYIRREEHGGGDGFQLEVDACFLGCLLDDGLFFLADRVDRCLVDELQLLAALFPNAVAAFFPACRFKQRIGLVNVEFPCRVRRAEARRIVDEIARSDAGTTVDEFLNALAIGKQRHGLTHSRIAEREMFALDAAPFAVDLGERIGRVELDELYVTAWHDVHFALAARFHALEHFVLNLQVPRVVVLARLQYGTRGRGRVAAAFHLDGIEERAVRHVVIHVDFAAHDVARLEVNEFVRPGTDRLEIGRRLARFGAAISRKQVLRNDHAFRRNEGRRPERRRFGERHLDGVRVNLVDLDVLVDARCHCSRRRILRKFPGEHAIVSRERLAVVPRHVLFQFPGHRLAIGAQPAIGAAWNLGGQNRHQIAIVVPHGEWFVEDARAFLVLGALREVRLQQGRPLPPQHLECTTAAPLGRLVRGGGLRLRNARVHEHHRRHRRGQAERDHLHDEASSRQFAGADVFDQILNFAFLHDDFSLWVTL